MNSMHNEPEYHHQPLQPFTYPPSINIFLLAIFCAIFIYVPYFLYYKLPHHYQISSQLKSAEKLFNDKDYYEAIHAYETIVSEFQNFKFGRIKLAQSSFRLSEKYDDLDKDLADTIFSIGLSYLAGFEFDKAEMKDLEQYVSAERMNDFKKCFKTKK